MGLLSVAPQVARDKLLGEICTAAAQLTSADKDHLWCVAALVNQLVRRAQATLADQSNQSNRPGRHTPSKPTSTPVRAPKPKRRKSKRSRASRKRQKKADLVRALCLFASQY